MRVLVVLQLLAAVSASRLDLSVQSLERPPEDLCERGSTVVLLGANNLRAPPPCCPSFRRLYVHRNLITELPEDWLLPCPHLTEVSVSQNALLRLPDRLLASASSLRRLQASSNYVDSLAPGLLRHATSLQELDLSHNQLKELPPTLLETTTQLTELYLQGNSLVSIPEQLLAKCSKLRQLWLSGNRLVALPAKLLAAAAPLRTLRLDHNEIVDLDSRAFSNNQQLHVVDLSSNNITSLPSGLFAHATSLRNLLLKNNRLRVAPAASCLPEKQITLDLRDNLLQTVEDFSVFGTSRVRLDGNKWRCGCSLAPVIREAASTRQLRWFQQRPVCYVDARDRHNFSEEEISQCQKSGVDSGGNTAATVTVHGSVSTYSNHSNGEAGAKTTSNAAAWEPENNAPQTATSTGSSTAPFVFPSIDAEVDYSGGF